MNLLLYEAARHAKNLNIKTMHLGGGNSLDENDSLYKFKLSMSTDINNFHFVGRVHKKIFLKCLKENGVKNILKLLINTKTFF